MSTRRKPKASPAAKPSGTEGVAGTNRSQLLALIAVAVTLAVVFAAVYLYTEGGDHDPYVPGQTGTLAPDFSAVDTEGNSFSLAQYRGSVVVLDFMGTTCEPCKTQIENLKAVHASYATRGVIVLSIDVNAGDTSGYLHDYKLERGAAWSFAVDTAGGSIEYSVTSIPTIVIIDQEGNMAKRNVGVMSAAEIAFVLNPLLGA